VRSRKPLIIADRFRTNHASRHERSAPGARLTRLAGRSRLSDRPLSSRFKDIGRRLVRDKQRVSNEPEASLEEKELRFGGRVGPIAVPDDDSSGWKSILHDTFRRSFVGYRTSAFKMSQLDQWWEDLTNRIEWEQPMVGERRLPRRAAWLTLGECRCTYRYGGTSWASQEMEPWFLEMTKKVCEVCGVSELPNSCNANLYKDGSQSVGWHADDEPLFVATQRDALIISLSLGDTRKFQIHPVGESSEITTLRLKDGDLCTMEGLMQRHYKHRVPREPDVREPRINLTWRWVRKHDSRCPLRHENVELPDDLEATPSYPSRPPLRKRMREDLDEEDNVSSHPRNAEEEEKKRKRRERFATGGTNSAASTAEARKESTGGREQATVSLTRAANSGKQADDTSEPEPKRARKEQVEATESKRKVEASQTTEVAKLKSREERFGHMTAGEERERKKKDEEDILQKRTTRFAAPAVSEPTAKKASDKKTDRPEPEPEPARPTEVKKVVLETKKVQAPVGKIVSLTRKADSLPDAKNKKSKAELEEEEKRKNRAKRFGT